MHVPRRGQRASRASSFRRARHDGVVMMMEDGRLRRIPHFSPSVGAVIQLLRKKQSLSKHLLWWFSNKRAWTTTRPRARLHYHSSSLHSGHQFICSQPRTNFSSNAEQQFFLMLCKLVEVDATIHLEILIALHESALERSFLPSGQGTGPGLWLLQLCWSVREISCRLLVALKVSSVSGKICEVKDQAGGTYTYSF